MNLRPRLAALLIALLALSAAPLWAQDGAEPAENAQAEADAQSPTETLPPPPRSAVDALPTSVVAGASSPQQLADAQQQAWSGVAARAIEKTESSTTTPYALSRLRDELDGWRSKFLDAQSANERRIATVQAQIAALGPEPEEGKQEDPLIAARRADLRERLGILRAPGLLAAERYTEATGLIAEIDALQRENDTKRLTQRGPSPLNPANWGRATAAVLTEFTAVCGTLAGAVAAAFSPQMNGARLPASAAFALFAFLILWPGRRLARRASDWLTQDKEDGPLGFVLSLGQILLPLAALWLFARSILLVGSALDPRAQTLLEALPGLALTVLIAHWLAGQLFTREDDHLFDLEPATRSRARWATRALGWTLAVEGVLRLAMETSSAAAELEGLVLFPLHILASFLLFELGRTWRLRPETEDEDDEDADPVPYRLRIAAWCGQLAQLAAIVSAALAALGYGEAVEALLYPAIISLALLGTVLLLQTFFNDLYAMFSTRSGASASGMVPVLFGIALILMLLPLLSLIWGARVTDLAELWQYFIAGFQIGETRISPSDFVLFAAVFVVGYMITRIVQGAMRSSVLPKTKLDKGGQNAVVSGLGYIGIFLAALIAITIAGIDLSSLAIVAGALSVGVGFGLQTVVSNFVSGIILLIERPISEGDWIEVGGQMGIVQNISVRSTRIQTFDRTDVIVPNADLVSGVVTNWTRGNSVGRIIVQVGAAYGSDTRRVEEILKEIARDHPMVSLRPEPMVLFTGFGASSLDFEIRAILRDISWGLTVGSEIRHNIARRFAEEGIEIPFPQRDLWLRNPGGLRSSGVAHEAPVQSAQPSGAPSRPVMPSDPSEMAGGGRTGDGEDAT